MHKLSCYLVHYEKPDWLLQSVESLLASNNVEVSVRVVDNGGLADSNVRLPAEVHVLTSGSNLGYAGGANLAIQHWRESAPGERYVLIGSHDLIVQPSALQALVKTLADRPEFGILGPRLRIGAMAPINNGDESPVIEARWLSGTCMLLRRECLDQLGGFDEIFGSYVEDVDICYRARAVGWKVGIVTSAEASGIGTGSRNPKYLMIRNDVIFRLKHRGLFAAAKGFIYHFSLGIWEWCVSAISRRHELDTSRLRGVLAQIPIAIRWLLSTHRHCSK